MNLAMLELAASVILTFSCTILPILATSSPADCKALDSLFLSVHQTGDEDHPVPACRCYMNGQSPTPVLVSTGQDVDARGSSPTGAWIGCTGHSMPAVFRALNALNGTVVSQLVIWDSSMSILPSDMFSKVNPTSLVIESSAASLVRNGTFSRIGPYLRHLRLNKNILKSVDRWTFSELDHLESLDFSDNKIDSLPTRGTFDSLTKLESLSFRNNHIAHIADGAFAGLVALKHLDLSGNQLSNITRDIFAGLEALETLSLRHNQLVGLETDAFAGLKNLRVLDLGGNRLERVVISDMPNLRQLRLNENHLSGLGQLQLTDAPNLESVHADHNELDTVGERDLEGLAGCQRLSSLSLSFNFIASIHHDAFKWVPSLRTLSLQQNALESLLGNGSASFLHPLTQLRRLHLSHNQLKEVDAGGLAGLAELEVLALDHNQLQRIEAGAFDGAGRGLRKLFLDSNRLYYLPQGLFDSFEEDKLKALDLSSNPWECICGQEWLGKWLRHLEPSALSAARGDMGCLAEMKECDEEEKTDQTVDLHSSSTWMIALAVIFSLVTITSMLAIGYLLVMESCWENRLFHRLRRVPSDMLQLLPETEKVQQPPVQKRMTISRATPGNAPLIRQPSAEMDPVVRAGRRDSNNNRKTVRFNDEVRTPP